MITHLNSNKITRNSKLSGIFVIAFWLRYILGKDPIIKKQKYQGDIDVIENTLANAMHLTALFTLSRRSL